MPKATIRDYRELVKKINDAPEGQRSEIAKDKHKVAEALFAEAQKKGKAERRKLKFTMDEINNS